MKLAILSDVHANGDALDAVVREFEKHRPDRVYHLGDLVGYNAEPEKCVQWAMENAAGGILGNHDAVVAGKASGEFFNAPALIAAKWAASRISYSSRDYLGGLPDRVLVEDEILLVHGSPSDPDRYLFSLADAAEELSWLAGKGGPPVVFFGHTHVAAAFVRRRDGRTVFVTPETVRLKEGERALLNPGSVGQPRDRNPLASFLLFDTRARSASWVRVPYDIAVCQRKVIDAGLPRFFAARLAEGT
ncbi:MAG: metallophosphoesterase family protein [Deltaproteobacteria bacterium]|nr:metallophosphoesterase family protein [Deltaproteobacteria bacterium]